jgi:alkylation response protein AidB-like acyl-CoA dehydrogenase
MTTELDPCLATLRDHADAADREAVWPLASWEALQRAGVLGWTIAAEHGGNEREDIALLEGYEALAAACLTTCFILSQRDAAVRRILSFAGPELARELLRPLACGGRFATVGLSQLTTSRQHQGPALRARLEPDRLILDGVIPWVTGASEADHFVVGAVLEDSKQILAVVPRDAPGVSVNPPLDLMALEGSLTAAVQCNQVELPRRWLLAGPAERVMSLGGRGGAGGLETSCLALGLAGAAIEYLHEEAAARPEVRPLAQPLEQERTRVRSQLHQLAREGGTPEASATLRGEANTLVLRATQVALTVSRGTGFVRPHPAQRWARQALFFLVWSCPRPAVEATLAFLTPSGDQETDSRECG